jgi:hypothetical protein
MGVKQKRLRAHTEVTLWHQDGRTAVLRRVQVEQRWRLLRRWALIDDTTGLWWSTDGKWGEIYSLAMETGWKPLERSEA